jgi:hypothetical protein
MTASYPNAYKVFATFHNYTDVIYAQSVNEMHDEILAIESTLGTNPFRGMPSAYTTFAAAIQDLYANKAPYTHTHSHAQLTSDNIGNDHPQYIQISGYPGFSHPVSGKAGSGNDLVPLSQLTGMGYQNAAQVEAMVDSELGNLMAGVDSGNAPLAGSIARTGPSWRVQGGLTSTHTDGNGIAKVYFAKPYANCVQAFVATKLPPIGGDGVHPPYAWVEAQMTLFFCSGDHAEIQFSHDYSWQQNMWVSFSWLVIGT